MVTNQIKEVLYTVKAITKVIYDPLRTVILLLLRPVSPMCKNPQRRKIVYGMHPVGCKEWSIWFEDFLVEYSVRVISVAIV